MKKVLLLLLTLIFAMPVWAADAPDAPADNPPATTSPEQTVQPDEGTPSAAPDAPLACTAQTCGGIPGCYLSRCGAVCTPC